MLKEFYLEGEEVECGVGVVEERRRFGSASRGDFIASNVGSRSDDFVGFTSDLNP
jgi:hypothetical protein